MKIFMWEKSGGHYKPQQRPQGSLGYSDLQDEIFVDSQLTFYRNFEFPIK